MALCKQHWIIFFYEFILISSWEFEKCVWRAFSSLVGGDLTEWRSLSSTSPVTQLGGLGSCSRSSQPAEQRGTSREPRRHPKRPGAADTQSAGGETSLTFAPDSNRGSSGVAVVFFMAVGWAVATCTGWGCQEEVEITCSLPACEAVP